MCVRLGMFVLYLIDELCTNAHGFLKYVCLFNCLSISLCVYMCVCQLDDNDDDSKDDNTDDDDDDDDDGAFTLGLFVHAVVSVCLGLH